MYSGVVSIDSVRLALFLSVLNDMRSCAADIGNAFLHGRSREHYAIRAGPEFGTYAGCILLIIGSLYRLRTSAARWHKYLSERWVLYQFVLIQIYASKTVVHIASMWRCTWTMLYSYLRIR